MRPTTDRKGVTAWGFIAGAWFIFLWGLVLYVWLGWMVPERKSHMEPEMTRAKADRALDNRVREQRLARPAQVPDQRRVPKPYRPETDQ